LTSFTLHTLLFAFSRVGSRRIKDEDQFREKVDEHRLRTQAAQLGFQVIPAENV